MPSRATALLLAVLACLFPACGAGGAFEEFADRIGSGGGGGGSIDDGSPIVPGTSFTEGELAWAMDTLDLVNEERSERGLAPLTFHHDAAEVAQAHNEDMRTRGFFDHDNPDGDGPAERLRAADITPGWSGENIARGQPTPEAVMASWMGSDGHRENILRPQFTHVGIGVLRKAGGPWWTQVFLSE